MGALDAALAENRNPTARPAATAPPTYQRMTYAGLEPSQAFDVVYGTHFEHRLISARHAVLVHERLMLDGLRLESGSYDFPVVARGAMPQDAWSLGLMAAGATATRYNSLALSADELQIYPPGVELLYQAASASRWINLTVPEPRLQAAVLARTGRPLALERRHACTVVLREGGCEVLTRLADDAFMLARAQGRAGLSEALAARIADELLAAYADALATASAGAAKTDEVSMRHRLQVVLACERLALPATGTFASLDDVARRSGYSRRSLELLFARSIGMPPGRWFMNIRLNGAMRELLAAAPSCSVAEVASRWGFVHLPRFAAQYRRAFGERPSQTLGRAQSR
jgi:AraC family transcriptional regulator, ethanolamine operon transcriptional activator